MRNRLSKENRVKSLCFILLLGLFVFPVSAKEKSKLNFLLITVDTLRPDRLSCYSDAHCRTPHIDQLAEKGVLFTKAFAHTPTTLPSHANILLGMTPAYHGVHDNSNFMVGEEFLSLAEHLKQNGYATGAFVGAFPVDSRFGLTQGFDVYDDNYGTKSSQEFSYVERRGEEVIGKALGWLRKQSSPWFLWVHCFDPHQRYIPPEPFRTEYEGHPYDGEVAYVDSVLGRLFGFLEESGHAENTLTVFTGDHGESLGEHGEATHGYFAYNSTIWVPLVIHHPGIKPGSVDQNACHIDIFPTACDVLGVEKPSFLQGISLVPAIQKGKKLPDRAIYFESLYPHYSRGWAPLRGYIKGSGKFLDSPIPEYYDLAKDFNELENLAEKKDLKRFKKLFRQLVAEQSIEGGMGREKKIDKETAEKLRSLGYISSPQVSREKKYTERDDLKVLLPYQTKLQSAMGAYHHGRTQEGVELLKDIISERKDFDLAYSYLATLYKELGKFREAVEVLRQGFQNNPASYKIIITYGIFLTEAGKYDAAVDVLKEGLAFIDYDPELWNYLGVAYWSQGDFPSAQNAYERALALDENYPVVFNNLGTLYLSRFLKSKQKEFMQKSMENFQKALELDPNYASAHNGLGSAYAQAGRLDASIVSWERAVDLKPDFDFPLYNLGLAYLAKGNKSKAFTSLLRYKELRYSSLSDKEKNKLDALIARCQEKK
jgi:arylsulfatase A-like enzyme/Flp pilus assembly protein TadD